FAADSSYSPSSRIIAAKAGGSNVPTLPLYLASNSCARSSSRLSETSICGSSGDAKRSVRFQRTSSAPVVFTASATSSGYSVSQFPHSPWLRPAAGIRPFVDRLGQLFEKRSAHGILVFERGFGRSATPAQASLHLF